MRLIDLYYWFFDPERTSDRCNYPLTGQSPQDHVDWVVYYLDEAADHALDDIEDELDDPEYWE